MTFMYVNGQLHWSTRTPTKRGFFNPPRSLIGNTSMNEPSTAMGRKELRAHERRMDADRVHLQPGILVVFQRKPYRIIETRELPLDLWGEKFEKKFANAVSDWERFGKPRGRDKPEKATWRDRPVSVVLTPAKTPQAEPIHLRVHASYCWDVLPEHHAVCVACGELPPCQHEIDEAHVQSAMDETEELISVQPGCCLGCTEPLTSRMKAVRFPGPNLWRPDLGENSAVFHARQECSGAAARYRRQWEATGQREEQQELPMGDV